MSWDEIEEIWLRRRAVILYCNAFHCIRFLVHYFNLNWQESNVFECFRWIEQGLQILDPSGDFYRHPEIFGLLEHQSRVFCSLLRTYLEVAFFFLEIQLHCLFVAWVVCIVLDWFALSKNSKTNIFKNLTIDHG